MKAEKKIKVSYFNFETGFTVYTKMTTEQIKIADPVLNITIL